MPTPAVVAPAAATVSVAPRRDAGATRDTLSADLIRAAANVEAATSSSKAAAADAGDGDAAEASAGTTKTSADRTPAKKRAKEKDDAVAKTGAPDKRSAADGGKSQRADRPGAIPANAPLPPSDGTLVASPGDGGKDTSADCKLAEKDMAREAWRRNWPTICPIGAGEKAFILIPIKGSLTGEVHDVRHHPVHEARVLLRSGTEPQLTLVQYKLKRFGFKELRINPTDDGGTRLRVRMQPGAGDPVFEVKEGYAKITVASPPPEK